MAETLRRIAREGRSGFYEGPVMEDIVARLKELGGLHEADDFDALIKHWLPLTLALNSLNRSMGHEDAYPFVLAAPVVEKLRLVHRIAHGG